MDTDEWMIALIVKAVKTGSGGAGAKFTTARFNVIQDRIRRWCRGPVMLSEGYCEWLWKAMIV